MVTYRSSCSEVFHLKRALFFCFNKTCFIIKKTLAQVFSCEFCEISKKTYSYRTTPMAASLHKRCWYFFAVSYQKICVSIILVSFFDEISNFRSRLVSGTVC